jgi:TldD protein
MTLIDHELAARVIEHALRHGGDFAELYVEDRHDFAVSLDDGRVERPRGGSERGASVRVVLGEATYFGHVDGLEEGPLLELAGSVAAGVRAQRRVPEHRPGATAAPAGRHAVAEAPQDVAPERKVALLRAGDEAARAAGDAIAQATVGYVESRRIVEVYNSDGLAAADDRTRTRLSVQAVARRDERVETGSDTRGGHAGFELVAGAAEEVARSAARKALTMLDAVDAPTGRLPVVVGNGFGGVLLHEAVGHGLEADAVHKRASVYADRIGDQLAAAGVTAYDDGVRANEWGSDGIDDEGTPTQRTTVIEDGRLTSFLHDLRSARRDGAPPTGNGRRESFRHLPVPRMTNTYFAPGEATVDELIGDVQRGLYAVSFGGGQVEPATGDFVFGVSEGYLIENGRVTAPVRGATLVGSGLEALAAIDGIAADLAIATGYCGKAGQTVPAGVGQPHVRIRELTVGGTA